jgi:hypothetical protein
MMKRLILICTILILSVSFNSFSAIEGDILSDDIAESADNETLRNEATLFDVIRQGVALSIAMCGSSDFCTPDVNASELEQLVDKLNHRINTLGVRYGETEDDELGEILLSYSNSLDSYNDFIAVLGDSSEDDFSDDFDDDFSDSDF